MVDHKDITTCSCGEKTYVVDTYVVKKTGLVRRRRVCYDCGERFSTIEIRAEEYDLLMSEIRARKSILLLQKKINKIADSL